MDEVKEILNILNFTDDEYSKIIGVFGWELQLF